MPKVLLEGGKPREVEEFDEGAESDAFWEALGGKAEYSTVPAVAAQHAPRLFQARSASLLPHIPDTWQIRAFEVRTDSVCD